MGRLPRRCLLRVATLAAGLAVAALIGCSGPASASFTGAWGQTANGQPNLTIADDGSFQGTDGCNRLSGKGSMAGDVFTFGPIAATSMACSGVDPWLSLADTAKVEGSALVLYRNGGNRVGTLPRQ
ncbi:MULTISPECIES: META domain-containing protein [unclassified Arthrobacter]|uniref:META domain-containing protein n=1 Tax=unclassified Arthrobacter TaxID=235627 RepID=UPI002E04A86C|nr:MULTISPECIES: META domain-containing protein [unclassified Arthrobacter]MEC5192464.1 heat shock protein HslJ [Arthrobacter sp. MP_M4]MEC5203948.1 heat shock protein HslJ [Arthrobacter sp. MP_M7]